MEFNKIFNFFLHVLAQQYYLMCQISTFNKLLQYDDKNKTQAILVMQNSDLQRLCSRQRAVRHVFAMKEKESF